MIYTKLFLFFSTSSSIRSKDSSQGGEGAAAAIDTSKTGKKSKSLTGARPKTAISKKAIASSSALLPSRMKDELPLTYSALKKFEKCAISRKNVEILQTTCVFTKFLVRMAPFCPIF